MGHAISIDLSPERLPLLVLVLLLTAFASAAMGLLVGTIIKPSQIAAMFPGFLMPVVFFWEASFYTWHQLAPLPVMQAITLIDPLTWINEAIRAVMTPQIYSLPLWRNTPWHGDLDPLWDEWLLSGLIGWCIVIDLFLGAQIVPILGRTYLHCLIP